MVDKMEDLIGKSWTVDVEDAGDGSGDCWIPIPDELIERFGWKEGDKVDFEVDEATHTIELKINQ